MRERVLLGAQAVSPLVCTVYILHWPYMLQLNNVSIPDYIINTFKKLQYKPSIHPQYSPHPFIPFNYSKKGETQYTMKEDTTPLLPKKEITHIQSIVGCLLYYDHVIDGTILTALNTIGHRQANPTATTKKYTQQLMDYLHTYSNTYLRFYASDMVLHVDSDAAYQVLPKSRSHIAGFYMLSDHPQKTSNPIRTLPILI